MNITKKKETHRYREQTRGYQWNEGRGRGNMRWGIKRYQLLGIKISYKGLPWWYSG